MVVVGTHFSPFLPIVVEWLKPRKCCSPSNKDWGEGLGGWEAGRLGVGAGGGGLGVGGWRWGAGGGLGVGGWRWGAGWRWGMLSQETPAPRFAPIFRFAVRRSPRRACARCWSGSATKTPGSRPSEAKRNVCAIFVCPIISLLHFAKGC